MRKRSMIVTILFSLVLGVGSLTVNAQEATVEPVVTEEIETRPEMEMTAEVTPEMEMTAEITPEMEMTAEVTPEMEVTSEVTPEMEVTSEVTPEMEVTSEVTPEIEMTPEIETTVATTPEIIATEIGNEFFPKTLPFSQALMDQLTLPEGFTINVFARDLGNPRMIAVSDSGVIYVSRPTQNDIIALFDQNSDGHADINGFRIVAINIPIAHGLAIQNNQLYIASEKQIFVADILDDGSLGALEIVTDNLPDGGQHGRRTLGFGPDGILYASIGSSCNACIETNPENATIVTVPLDGLARTVFAEGLRNSMGFAWHPETGEMWAMDNGSDWRGDDMPAEELNMIESGYHYGWPLCYENKAVDPFMPAQTSLNNV